MRISVAVPVYNEEGNVRHAIERVSRALGNDLHEIVFVDDGSRDATFDELRAAALADPRVKVLSFSRNFGHQIAVSAALEHATGEAVVIIDGDMQDPPEVIPELITKWREGYEIVYATRRSRGDTFAKRVFAALFYRILRSLADVPIPLDAGDFALLDRKVVDVLARMPERSRYLRGLRAWSGYRSIGVPYDRHARERGESKYTLKQMLDLATSGIIGFSIVPLRLAVYVGLAFALLSALGACWVIVEWFLGGESLVRGWASLMLAVFFVGGVQLFIIGVLGEYIGRIYREVQGRPLYIVREKIGFGAQD